MTLTDSHLADFRLADFHLADFHLADADCTATDPAVGTPGPAIRARGVCKAYGSSGAAVLALRGVDLDVAAGTFTAVMGPSGSGKSTMLHCLAGLDKPDGGSIAYADAHAAGGWTEIIGMSDYNLTRLRRERIGFVFQSCHLLPMLTAEQNILLPLELAGRRIDREWLAALVDLLGIGDRLGHLPAQLSAGQQQRVACARALVTRPAVAFADEPTGSLDSRATAEVLSFLGRCVHDLGQTVVMITHDANAAAYADRVVLMSDGGIAGEIADPTPATVLDTLLRLGQDG